MDTIQWRSDSDNHLIDEASGQLAAAIDRDYGRCAEHSLFFESVTDQCWLAGKIRHAAERLGSWRSARRRKDAAR